MAGGVEVCRAEPAAGRLRCYDAAKHWGDCMPSRYRVALQGFSEFERTTLAFCIHHAATREPGYVQVELIADSDFIVADASHEPIAGSVTRGERMADTLFIGEQPPFGAGAHLQRPIDPERILRALDKMAARRGARAPEPGPDIVLPLDAPAYGTVPFADSESADTSPAAFRHEPLSFKFDKLQPFDALEVAMAHASAVAAAQAADAAAQVTASLHAAADPSTSMASIARAAALIVPDLQATTSPARVVEPQPPSTPEPALARPAVRERKGPVKPLVLPGTYKRDAAVPVATTAPAAKPQEPRKPPRLNAAERAEAKAAARRASRLARLSQAAARAVGAPCDVLLLDNAPEPTVLGALLEAFGFLVHRADSIAAAMAVLERTPLAAAFLDVAAEDLAGIDGLDLCQRIKHRQVPLAGAVPVVMLLSARDSAAGRVRAKLAGCDAFLTRPAERGAVARALESCNVPLPADARRS